FSSSAALTSGFFLLNSPIRLTSASRPEQAACRDDVRGTARFHDVGDVESHVWLRCRIAGSRNNRCACHQSGAERICQIASAVAVPVTAPTSFPVGTGSPALTVAVPATIRLNGVV